MVCLSQSRAGWERTFLKSYRRNIKNPCTDCPEDRIDDGVLQHKFVIALEWFAEGKKVFDDFMFEDTDGDIEKERDENEA